MPSLPPLPPSRPDPDPAPQPPATFELTLQEYTELLRSTRYLLGEDDDGEGNDKEVDNGDRTKKSRPPLSDSFIAALYNDGRNGGQVQSSTGREVDDEEKEEEEEQNHSEGIHSHEQAEESYQSQPGNENHSEEDRIPEQQVQRDGTPQPAGTSRQMDVVQEDQQMVEAGGLQHQILDDQADPVRVGPILRMTPGLEPSQARPDDVVIQQASTQSAGLQLTSQASAQSQVHPNDIDRQHTHQQIQSSPNAATAEPPSQAPAPARQQSRRPARSSFSNIDVSMRTSAVESQPGANEEEEEEEEQEQYEDSFGSGYGHPQGRKPGQAVKRSMRKRVFSEQVDVEMAFIVGNEDPGEDEMLAEDPDRSGMEVGRSLRPLPHRMLDIGSNIGNQEHNRTASSHQDRIRGYPAHKNHNAQTKRVTFAPGLDNSDSDEDQYVRGRNKRRKMDASRARAKDRQRVGYNRLELEPTMMVTVAPRLIEDFVVEGEDEVQRAKDRVERGMKAWKELVFQNEGKREAVTLKRMDTIGMGMSLGFGGQNLKVVEGYKTPMGNEKSMVKNGHSDFKQSSRVGGVSNGKVVRLGYQPLEMTSDVKVEKL